jgi:hypothetical protein
MPPVGICPTISGGLTALVRPLVTLLALRLGFACGALRSKTRTSRRQRRMLEVGATAMSERMGGFRPLGLLMGW